MSGSLKSFGPTRLPDLALVLAFKTVAEQGSFTKASTLLHLSQSAVSQQVLKLEENLGVQLLLRSTRTVSLTAEGSALLSDIALPLEQMIRAFDRCANRGSSQLLCIEAEPVLSAVWLAPRLKHFTAQHPAINIQLLLTTLRMEFPDNVEFAIKWGGGSWPGFDAEYLLGCTHVPMCSPSLVEGPNAIREPSDLGRVPLLHDRHYEDWENWQASYCVPGLNPDTGHIVSESNMLAQLAVEGNGVALCALELTEKLVRSGELVIPFPNMAMVNRKAYYIVTRRSNVPGEAAQSFIGWLKREASASLK